MHPPIMQQSVRGRGILSLLLLGAFVLILFMAEHYIHEANLQKQADALSVLRLQCQEREKAWKGDVQRLEQAMHQGFVNMTKENTEKLTRVEKSMDDKVTTGDSALKESIREVTDSVIAIREDSNDMKPKVAELYVNDNQLVGDFVRKSASIDVFIRDTNKKIDELAGLANKLMERDPSELLQKVSELEASLKSLSTTLESHQKQFDSLRADIITQHDHIQSAVTQQQASMHKSLEEHMVVITALANRTHGDGGPGIEAADGAAAGQPTNNNTFTGATTTDAAASSSALTGATTTDVAASSSALTGAATTDAAASSSALAGATTTDAAASSTALTGATTADAAAFSTTLTAASETVAAIAAAAQVPALSQAPAQPGFMFGTTSAFDDANPNARTPPGPAPTAHLQSTDEAALSTSAATHAALSLSTEDGATGLSSSLESAAGDDGDD